MSACIYCEVNEDAPSVVHHFACPHGTNEVEIVASGGRENEWPEAPDGLFELRGVPYEWVATKVTVYLDE